MPRSADRPPFVLPSANRSWLQRLVAKGFAPPARDDRDIVVLRDTGAAPSPLPVVAVFLPTMVRRAALPDHGDYLRAVATQLVVAASARRARLHLFFAMQYDPGDAALAAQLVAEASAILRAALVDQRQSVGLTALTLKGPGKVVSINAMTTVALRHGVAAVILIDDDVAFSPGCLARLIDAHLDGNGQAAIGASKVGSPLDTRASSILHTLKSFTQPAKNYPHACCMIVPMAVIAPDIPPIYSSDDGYICFRLLDGAGPEPLRYLRLIDDAECYHLVGHDSTGEIRARMRRMLLHHHLFLSHSSPANARFYLAQLLFFGMWPWVRFDRSQGIQRGIVKCLLKHLYSLWFGKIGLELVVRGLVGRPLRAIDWGSS